MSAEYVEVKGVQESYCEFGSIMYYHKMLMYTYAPRIQLIGGGLRDKHQVCKP